MKMLLFGQHALRSVTVKILMLKSFSRQVWATWDEVKRLELR